MMAGSAEQFLQSLPADTLTIELDGHRLQPLRTPTSATAEFGILGKFEGLRELSMVDVDCHSLRGFPHLSHLYRLNLANNKVQSIEPLAQARLFHLVILDLSNNKISDFKAIEALQNLPALRRLHLYECPLTNDADYREMVFAMLPSLEVLDGQDQDGNEVGENDEAEEVDEYETEGDDTTNSQPTQPNRATIGGKFRQKQPRILSMPSNGDDEDDDDEEEEDEEEDDGRHRYGGKGKGGKGKGKGVNYPTGRGKGGKFPGGKGKGGKQKSTTQVPMTVATDEDVDGEEDYEDEEDYENNQTQNAEEDDESDEEEYDEEGEEEYETYDEDEEGEGEEFDEEAEEEEEEEGEDDIDYGEGGYAVEESLRAASNFGQFDEQGASHMQPIHVGGGFSQLPHAGSSTAIPHILDEDYAAAPTSGLFMDADNVEGSPPRHHGMMEDHHSMKRQFDDDESVGEDGSIDFLNMNDETDADGIKRRRL